MFDNMNDATQNEISFDISKLKVVPIDQVRPNGYNPKDKDTQEYKTLVESIRFNGLRGCIVVRENPNDTSLFEIIDGEQRFRACIELGYSKIIIYNEGVVDDKKAKELTLWWQVQVPFNEHELSKMLAKMTQEYENIAVPYSQERIEEMQKVAKFFEEQKNETAELPPPPDEGNTLNTFSLQVTKDQYSIYQFAIEKAKDTANTNFSDSDALTYVCQQYLQEGVQSYGQ